jgi:acyl carrier protein
MLRPIVMALAGLALVLIGCGRNDAAAPQPRTGTAKAASAPVSDVSAKVIEIVAEQTGVDPRELSRNTHLRRDLKTDDLDQVELVMELEDTYHISIPDADAEQLQTIGRMIDYVRAHVKQ